MELEECFTMCTQIKAKITDVLLDHFVLSILPMSIFGPLSLICWLYATFVDAVFGKKVPQMNGKV